MKDFTANERVDSSDQDDLVAYLDGEVDDHQRERIEQRLATDDKYRQLLVRLQSTWQLLDRLPTAQADESFTKTTIAMVATQFDAATDQPVPAALTKEKTRRRLLKLAALAAVAVVGFLLVAVPSALRQRAEIRDLPVIENAELYRFTENIEFLRMLDDANLFDDEDEYAL